MNIFFLLLKINSVPDQNYLGKVCTNKIIPDQPAPRTAVLFGTVSLLYSTNYVWTTRMDTGRFNFKEISTWRMKHFLLGLFLDYFAFRLMPSTATEVYIKK